MTRILEFGEFTIFARTTPDATVRFWTGRHPADSLGETPRRWSPRRLLELHRFLRKGAFDVIACHVPIQPLRPGSPVALAYAMVSRTRSAPLAALDLSDHVRLTPTALRVLDRCRVYCKRELPLRREELLVDPSSKQRDVLARNLSKFHPVTIGLAPWRMEGLPDPVPEKSTDVFYSGTFTPEIRRRGAGMLARLSRQGVRVDLSRERLGREEYLRRTARAYLVWSPEGLGWQCFRHLEAAAAGSVPVINRPRIEMPEPLRHGEHCFHYDPDGEDLVRVIRAALADKERLGRMGEAARLHVAQHHMHASMAAGILRAALAERHA